MILKIDKEAMLRNITGYNKKQRASLDFGIGREEKTPVSKQFIRAGKQELQDQSKLMLIAGKIFDKALQYTPVKTGNLRDSMYMAQISKGVDIGYEAEYATFVHEIPMYNHEPPTQYKFLEDAAFEVMNDVYQVMHIKLPMTIEYDPLVLHIGVKDSKGKDLYKIKSSRMKNDEVDWEKQLDKFLDTISKYEYQEDIPQKARELYDYMMKWVARLGDRANWAQIFRSGMERGDI